MTLNITWQDLVEKRFAAAFGSGTNITRDDDCIHIGNHTSFIEVMCDENNSYTILLCQIKNGHKRFKSITEDNYLSITSAIAMGWESESDWEDEE